MLSLDVNRGPDMRQRRVSWLCSSCRRDDKATDEEHAAKPMDEANADEVHNALPCTVEQCPYPISAASKLPNSRTSPRNASPVDTCHEING